MLAALTWVLTAQSGIAQDAAGTKEMMAARVAAPTAPAAESRANITALYRIGPGDVLQINVWKEPEASVPSVVVRSDGIISVPLLKEISVLGLTPHEVEELLIARLSKLIRDADVTVVVKEIHSEKVYLIGGVKKEGPLMLTEPLSVLQAVSAAGGFTDYAKRKKIYVLRQESGRQVRIPFDYEAVIKGSHPDRNIMLQPGDTVVVPN